MSDEQRAQPDRSSAEETTFSAKKSSPDLLRHVLEATLAQGETDMTAEEWQSLQAIAREHREAQLPIDRAAPLLVAALLATRFPDLARPETHAQMCQRISDSLCGDPTAMQRLKTFWNQLSESVS
ncbi:MAG: hypothetical protein KDA45_07895 [Planctomycetales bacterium]|nr:hypothetical protein [Planctomycetales bacterium]